MKNLKITRRHALPVLIVAAIVGCLAVPALATDPLPSWRDGPNKQRIIAFVEQVTTPGSPSFVVPEDRVATFDMDGTILLEKPAYALFAFAIPLIKSAAAAQPALLERPHVKAIVDGDMKYFAEYEYAVEEVNQLAAKNGWQVISMKKDCQRIFDFSR